MVENEEDWTFDGGLFFDAEVDVDWLEDREVGYPANDFDPGGQRHPGPPADGAPDQHGD